MGWWCIIKHLHQESQAPNAFSRLRFPTHHRPSARPCRRAARRSWARPWAPSRGRPRRPRPSPPIETLAQAREHVGKGDARAEEREHQRSGEETCCFGPQKATATQPVRRAFCQGKRQGSVDGSVLGFCEATLRVKLRS